MYDFGRHGVPHSLVGAVTVSHGLGRRLSRLLAKRGCKPVAAFQQQRTKMGAFGKAWGWGCGAAHGGAAIIEAGTQINQGWESCITYPIEFYFADCAQMLFLPLTA